MYRKSEFLEELKDEIVIWRYMTFASFISLIMDSQLIFRKASTYKDIYDCDALYDDESEAILTNALRKVKEADGKPRYTITQSSNNNIDSRLKAYYKGNEYRIVFNSKGNKIQSNSSITFCNSWHMNDYENYSLWRIYLDNHQEGIAIKTTIGNLKKSLAKVSDDIFIGKVNYVDTRISINDKTINEHSVVLRKRKQYSYEKEIRAFIVKEEENIGEPPYDLLMADVVLEELIQEIWVSPFVGGVWFKYLIESLLIEKGLNLPVKSSEIIER